MARDVVLLRRAEMGQPCVRLYVWETAWVTLGRHQRPSEALLVSTRTPWAIRPTGGRAVLHGHDLTIGLAAPLSALGLTDHRSLREVYRAAIAPILLALRDCGVPAVLGEDLKRERDKLARSADCFLAISSNDVVSEDTGLKVCGCAMRVTDRAVLVQGSIPVQAPLVDPSTLYRHAAPVKPIHLHQHDLVAAFRDVLQA